MTVLKLRPMKEVIRHRVPERTSPMPFSRLKHRRVDVSLLVDHVETGLETKSRHNHPKMRFGCGGDVMGPHKMARAACKRISEAPGTQMGQVNRGVLPTKCKEGAYFLKNNLLQVPESTTGWRKFKVSKRG